MDLVRAIATRDDMAFRLVGEDRGLARMSIAMRSASNTLSDINFKSIEHYAYGGDTALRIAATAHDRAMALTLLTRDA